MPGFPDIVEEWVKQKLYLLGVRPEDVEERFVRGTGAGGQKINKTSSTVWLRHGPTGVEARCQDERSQSVNRARAWAELCSKLLQRRDAAKAKAQDERQTNLRRRRQKSRGQKVRMIESKKHRAGIKSTRRRPEEW